MASVTQNLDNLRVLPNREIPSIYRCAQIVLRPVCRYLLFPFDSRVVNVLKLDSVIFLGLMPPVSRYLVFCKILNSSSPEGSR